MDEIDIYLYKQSEEYKNEKKRVKRMATAVITSSIKNKHNYTLSPMFGLDVASIILDQVIEDKIGVLLNEVKSTGDLLKLMDEEMNKMVMQN